MRFIFIIAFISASVFAYSQDIPEKENSTAFYANIGYAPLKNFQLFLQLPTNELDRVLLGVHILRNVNLYEMNGNGFGGELQYRWNFNRDKNVYYKNMGYWGMYSEFDGTSKTNRYDDSTDKFRGFRIGVLTGSTIKVKAHFAWDIFYGVGLSFINYSYDSQSYNYNYSNTLIHFKGGIMIGIY